MNYIEEKIKELTEKWAEQEHKRWAKWQEYMHSQMHYFDDTENSGRCGYLLDNSLYDRWERQINTDYKDLSEEEKESDREQVYPYLEDVKKLLEDCQKRERKRIMEMIEKEVAKIEKDPQSVSYGTLSYHANWIISLIKNLK